MGETVCCSLCRPTCGVFTITVLLWLNGLGSLADKYFRWIAPLYLICAFILTYCLINRERRSSRKCAQTTYKLMLAIECILFVIVIVACYINETEGTGGRIFTMIISVILRIWFITCINTWYEEIIQDRDEAGFYEAGTNKVQNEMPNN